jgi:hypothetical protein
MVEIHHKLSFGTEEAGGSALNVDWCLVVRHRRQGIGSKWWMGSKWLPVVVKYSMLEHGRRSGGRQKVYVNDHKV